MAFPHLCMMFSQVIEFQVITSKTESSVCWFLFLAFGKSFIEGNMPFHVASLFSGCLYNFLFVFVFGSLSVTSLFLFLLFSLFSVIFCGLPNCFCTKLCMKHRGKIGNCFFLHLVPKNICLKNQLSNGKASFIEPSQI